MGRKGQIILPNLLTDHPSILLSLVENLMILPGPVAGEAGEVRVEVEAVALPTPQGVGRSMLLASVLAPELQLVYLQGGLQDATSKSLRRTSQYMPHSSGRLGTNWYFLQGHYWQAVLNFFPKKASRWVVIPCPQKHLECCPSLKHSDFF